MDSDELKPDTGWLLARLKRTLIGLCRSPNGIRWSLTGVRRSPTGVCQSPKRVRQIPNGVCQSPNPVCRIANEVRTESVGFRTDSDGLRSESDGLRSDSDGLSLLPQQPVGLQSDSCRIPTGSIGLRWTQFGLWLDSGGTPTDSCWTLMESNSPGSILSIIFRTDIFVIKTESLFLSESIMVVKFVKFHQKVLLSDANPCCVARSIALSPHLSSHLRVAKNEVLSSD